MLLQCGVKEKTKYAVSLGAWGAVGGVEESAFYTTNAGLSTVQRTVNTKYCVSKNSLSCICIRLAFCR